MSFVFQLHDEISDNESLAFVIRIPGKYNPDILEDGKRRLLDLYKEALAVRAEYIETNGAITLTEEVPGE